MERKTFPGRDPSATSVQPTGGEEACLRALDRHGVLGTVRERAFDDIAELAAGICDTPAAAVTLVGATVPVLKAETGIGLRAFPAGTGLCRAAIARGDVLHVSDTRRDRRFADDPLVTGAPGWRFYAGAPLRTADGLPLGTVCVLDTRPRRLTARQRDGLRCLARQAMALLEHRGASVDEPTGRVGGSAHPLEGGRAKEDLRRAREQLRLAVEATGTGIFDYDLVTDTLEWDARTKALYGLPPDAPVNYDVFLAGLHADDRGWVDEAVRSALDPAGGGAYDIAFRVIGLGDGVERWVAAKGQAYFADGRATRFVGTTRDVTESRRAEQVLRETEERYRLAGRATNDAIWDWNLGTDHILWNEAVQTLFGYAAEDVGASGSWWKSHIHSGDRERVKAGIHAVIDGTGTSWKDEYRFLRADGSYADILDRGYVIRDAGGKATRMIGAMLDISERKRAEEHQRLLAGELQHRVKNTLALVQAIASQTLRGATDVAEMREAFSARLISLGRAHDILTQASWTAAPIAEVVEGVLSVHRQADAARIRPSGPNVLLAAQPALSLALALHELATNAAKYGALSNAAGTVDLRWHVVLEGEAPRFCLTWSEQGGPPVLAPPTRKGFGSRLIERSFATEVGGEVKLTFAPTGLTCRLEAPLASMQEARNEAAA